MAATRPTRLVMGDPRRSGEFVVAGRHERSPFSDASITSTRWPGSADRFAQRVVFDRAAAVPEDSGAAARSHTPPLRAGLVHVPALPHMPGQAGVQRLQRHARLLATPSGRTNHITAWSAQQISRTVRATSGLDRVG